MKVRVPVHVSMDLEVEVSAGRKPDPADLRRKAEEAVEKKMHSMFGPSSRFSGGGRARATPTKSKDERGQLVFSQPRPRKKPPGGEGDDISTETS